MTRILVTGSRNWPTSTLIDIVLDAALKAHGQNGLTLVHGDCPTGADHFADLWGRRHADQGVVVERHPADWKMLGKAAGPIRNEAMVQTHPNLVLAFLMPDSRGTQDSIRRAEREGIRVRRFHSSTVDALVGGGSV